MPKDSTEKAAVKAAAKARKQKRRAEWEAKRERRMDAGIVKLKAKKKTTG